MKGLMPTHKGCALVERVLRHLAKQEGRAKTSGSYEEWHAAKAAWWIQYLTFYDSAPDAYSAAIEILGKPPAPQCHVEIPENRNSLSPAIHSPNSVDGRNGRQWVQSVLHYLEWRAGQKWRPLSGRFTSEAEHYVHAIRAVTQAFYASVEPDAVELPAPQSPPPRPISYSSRPRPPLRHFAQA